MIKKLLLSTAGIAVVGIFAFLAIQFLKPAQTAPVTENSQLVQVLASPKENYTKPVRLQGKIVRFDTSTPAYVYDVEIENGTIVRALDFSRHYQYPPSTYVEFTGILAPAWNGTQSVPVVEIRSARPLN